MIKLFSRLVGFLNPSILLLVFVLFLPSIQARAASFYMDGVCRSDVVGLMETFESNYPKSDGSTLFFITYPSTITPAGVLTSRISRLNLTTGFVVNGVVFSTQLMDCSAPGKLGVGATGDVQYMLAILAAIFALLFGFHVGKNLSPPKLRGGE